MNEYDYLFDKAIEDLKEEYEKAKDFTFVNNPVVYALYQVWRKYDTQKKDNKR